MDKRTISIVVPVCNEQDSLHELMRQITDTVGQHAYQVEVVFVDDGSSDESWSQIMALAEQDPRVGGLRFRSNAGKAAALMAGFSAVRGEVVITMDADLQDPPQEIPRLVAKLDEGYDLVSGWKLKRFDPWHKVYPSRIFNLLIGQLTGVHLHDHVCGLKCYRRHVLGDVRIHGDLHRFLAVFVAAHGHRVTEIPTQHRPRTTGRGKYGFSRYAKGLMDLGLVLLKTRFRWRPQHMIGVLGTWVMLLGLLLWVLEAWWLLQCLLVLLMGGLLVIAGWIAELIVTQRPLERLYEIVERTGWCARRAGETR